MKRLVATLAATALLVVGCGAGDDVPPHGDADVAFVQGMLPHHQQGVDMAEMTAAAGASPEVQDLAQRIDAAQSKEIDTMEEWLDDWDVEDGHHGSADHGDHDMAGMMSDADMASLGTTEGTAFDRAWLTMMVAHHEGAVEMARTEIADGENPDAKALAESIVETQQAEITEMKGLLADA